MVFLLGIMQSMVKGKESYYSNPAQVDCTAICSNILHLLRRGGRVVECTGLENQRR